MWPLLARGRARLLVQASTPSLSPPRRHNDALRYGSSTPGPVALMTPYGLALTIFLSRVYPLDDALCQRVAGDMTSR